MVTTTAHIKANGARAIILLYQIFGWTLMVVGLLLFWSPLPLGFLLIAIGLSIVVSHNALLARHLRALRQDHQGLNERANEMEDVLPEPIADTLRKTKPQ